MASFASGGPSSAASAILSSVLENIKSLPASSQVRAHSAAAASSSAAPRFDCGVRLFGRQKPLHDLLGGGPSADILLWRRKDLSAGFLVVATAIWVLFEWIGYHFISVVSFVLLLLVVGLFAWSNGAALLNRDPPPLPNLELSDETVLRVAKALNKEMNRMLNLLHEVAIGKDVKRFLQLSGGLSLLVLLGSWFKFLTLLYLGVLAAHTIPILYEKNEDALERFAERALNELSNQYEKVDASLRRRIPRGVAGAGKKSV